MGSFLGGSLALTSSSSGGSCMKYDRYVTVPL